jgi:pyrimidine operon attenuation protein/uracil phosphoribosyltransferase
MPKAKKNIKEEIQNNIQGKVVMTDEEIRRALTRIAHEIVESNKGAKDIALIGILNRGYPLAKRLAKVMQDEEKIKVPVGALDVSLYRDDLRVKGKYITIRKTTIPFAVEDKTLVLVDDVIYAGRTVRAALDGLKDYGRAARVQLAVLVDRGHRELPVQPDFTGRNIPTSKSEDISVKILEIDGVDEVVLK